MRAHHHHTNHHHHRHVPEPGIEGGGDFGPDRGPGRGHGRRRGPGIDDGAEFGPERGPRGPRGHRRHGRGGRASRGDVRTAVLLLLQEEPMHGYQLMQTIADRTQGVWTPSPGAIYPALNLLEDEGLVEVRAEGGRKLATLTEAGRAHVAEHQASWADPFDQAAGAPGEPGVDLRSLLEEIRDATRHLARSGDQAQLTAAAELLGRTRRELYLLLAGD